MSELRSGWQAGPTERGTLTLVYSCLFTIFTCTWTVLHLNVPGLHDGPWTNALRKAKWMAITVLIPEFIFSKAICDLRLALNDLREFDDELQEQEHEHDDHTWTISSKKAKHTYSWQVDYGPRASLLYRIMGLQPPVSRKRPAEKIAEPENNNPITRSSKEGVAQEGHEGPTEEISTGEQESAEDQVLAEDQMLAEDRSDSSSNLRRQQAKNFNPFARTQPVITYHTAQNWTLTHAYFANMGGLLYPQGPFSQLQKLKYSVLPGVKLGHRYFWTNSRGHLLQGLVLGKEDIMDKSKADWLVKSLAVLQITWLVLTVLVRGVKGLPVSQLEIATLAFSIFAIATYVANWGKPKDVARPILLQNSSFGSTKTGMQNPTQELTMFVMKPSKAAKKAEFICEESRVQNDKVWVEGGVPLIFRIMAVSALVFGGLHTLAWNFGFPSRVELILWRVASLTSMILPIISLAFSLCLNYLATAYLDSVLISFLIKKLDLLNAFPPDFWKSLSEPAFENWDWEDRVTLICTPTGSRNFNERPLREERSQLDWRRDVENVFQRLREFDSLWERAKQGERNAHLLKTLGWNLSWMTFYADPGLDFLDDFEDYLRNKFVARGTAIPGIKCIRHIIEVGQELEKEMKRLKTRRDSYDRASQVLTITSSIIYIASRLIILVLLFTSLRMAPEGIYKVTPWTRFLPTFS